MAAHDHSYKLLFSHPRMVRDLIAGFIQRGRSAAIDLLSLEKANTHFVSDHLKTRASDMVWCVRSGGRACIYLLMEFQSTVEHFMAVRMLAYVALLYQDLVKPTGRTCREIPPIVPIVLYSGNRRWNAPTSLAALSRTDVLLPRGFRAHVRYKLINVRRQRFDAPHLKHNLAAAMFRIENSRSRREVGQQVSLLLDLLKGSDTASLRRAFSVWINNVVLVRLPGGRLNGEPNGQLNGDISLERMHSVLGDSMDRWEKQYLANGRRAGLREGLRVGARRGKADMLLALLHGRFGRELPRGTKRRVKQATTAQLNRWGTRLLDAQSLEELFGRKRRTPNRRPSAG
jgi:hypothetical protein